MTLHLALFGHVPSDDEYLRTVSTVERGYADVERPFTLSGHDVELQVDIVQPGGPTIGVDLVQRRFDCSGEPCCIGIADAVTDDRFELSSCELGRLIPCEQPLCSRVRELDIASLVEDEHDVVDVLQNRVTAL